MTKKQFKHDFLKGLGSALVELQANPITRHHDSVRYGCLHVTAYDSQSEGNRGWYLYQSLKYIDHDNTIMDEIIERYFKITYNVWLFEQLTAILFYSAIDESENSQSVNSQNVLYQQYDILLQELSRKRRLEGSCERRDMFSWLCVWLTSLDGWNAFQKIVFDVSKMLLPKDIDFFFDEWFYDNSRDKFGKKRVENYLHKQAQKSVYVCRYYEKALSWDTRKIEKRPTPTLESVLANVTGETHRGRWQVLSYTRNASSEDLERLAQEVIKESDICRKSELLWGFRRRAYPFPQELVLEWSQSDNSNLRETAFHIMGHNPSKEVHDYAVSMINSKQELENGLFLLSKTYQAADEELLFSTIKYLQENNDQYDFHSAAMTVVDAIASVRSRPKTDILMFLYQEMPCSYCRYHIVQLMYKKKLCSETLLKECCFDSNSDIREFAKSKF